MTRTQRVAEWCTVILFLLDKRPPGAEASRATTHDLHHVVNGIYHGIAASTFESRTVRPLQDTRAELREAEDIIREKFISEGLATMHDTCCAHLSIARDGSCSACGQMPLEMMGARQAG